MQGGKVRPCRVRRLQSLKTSEYVENDVLASFYMLMDEGIMRYDGKLPKGSSGLEKVM
jgi:hypothetical protein